MPEGAEQPNARGQSVGPLVSYTPLVLFTALTLFLGDRLQPWQFMWLLALAIFVGLKWLTWCRAKHVDGTWRSFAYLFAWPGMDSESFLDRSTVPLGPTLPEWTVAFLKTIAGAILLWVVARNVPAGVPLLRGWIGMIGMVLLLHFGTFHLLALFWQRMGVVARPLMDAPLRSTSLAEFWGRRWNIGFRQLAHDLVFQPLHRRIGVRASGLAVFVMSGLIHDLVISVPARAGYGLPTMYFVIQGLGAQFERSRFGVAAGLRGGFRGWLFAAVVAAAPAYWLFHPWFVTRVILPFMQALRAL